MKIFFYFIVIFVGIWSCSSTGKTVAVTPDEEALFQKKGNDTVHLGDEESEYDIIIIEPGFNFLVTKYCSPTRVLLAKLFRKS